MSNQSFPLTYSQQALWFIHQDAPNSAAYNIALPLQFSSAVDTDHMRDAVKRLVKSHSALQLVFSESDGIPYQQCNGDADIEFQMIDASKLSVAELEYQLAQHTQAVFDLNKGVFRAVLFQGHAQSSTLLLVLHHIAGDASSLSILGSQLLKSLAQPEAETTGVTASDYRDYVDWEAALLNGPKGQRMMNYWQKRLSGEVPVLQLPTDKPRPLVQSYNGASRSFSLPLDISIRLRELASAKKSSVFSLLLTAWQVVLHRYTGQDDIWVGVPTSTPRNQSAFTDMVGYLVNPMIVRSQFTQGQALAFSTLLVQTGEQVLKGLYHQPYPFVQLIEQLQAQRDLSYPPLVQASFAYEQESLIPRTFTEAKLSARRCDIAQMEGQFDLSLTWVENEEHDALVGTLSYNRDLFNASTIDRLQQHIGILLAGIAEAIDGDIYRLPLLTKAEQAQQKVWNDTALRQPKDVSLIEIFERQARSTPSNIALIAAGQQWSYAQLNQQSNQLAHYLIERLQTRGQQHTPPLIAIAAERSIASVCAMLAVLKAGAAYIPIDPSYPPERIYYMLEHSEASLLLLPSDTSATFADAMAVAACECCQLSRIQLENYSTANPNSAIVPDQLAYIIYTSGSTGKPKGVMIDHRGAVNTVLDINRRFSITAGDRMLMVSGLSFDLSVYDVFGILASGASLVIPEASREKEPAHWLELMQAHRVSLWNTVPALMHMLVDYISAHSDDIPNSLRLCLMSGDYIPLNLVPQIQALWPSAQVISLGGATEASIWSIIYPINNIDPNWQTIPYGKPLSNQSIYILSDALELCPVGVAGQICIGGVGLAQGYWRDEQKTANSFVIHPRSQERLYLTGDKGRYSDDGTVEFLGREDSQVKIRGFRIELGEIETLLNQHQAVKHALAMVHRSDSGDSLYAYVVLDENKPKISTQDLFACLHSRLPEYMLPTQIVCLDTLPLTDNGKVNRKALKPLATHSQTGTKPKTQTEKALVNIWQDLLSRPVHSREDHFFVLGGQSLLATRLLARIRRHWGITLSLANIFELPVLSQLAEKIDREQILPATALHEDERKSDHIEASFGQQRMWFLDQFETSQRAQYNIPLVFDYSGTMDIEVFHQSIVYLFNRHQSLRMYFGNLSGKPVLNIAKVDSIDEEQYLSINDYRLYDDEQQSIALARHADEFLLKPFDLSCAPLFRISIELLRDNQARLTLCMHHIIGDGWSTAIFTRELALIYSALQQHQTVSLPELTYQYTDYAASQRRWLETAELNRQLDYWTRQLADAPTLLDLPSDQPRPAQQSYRGAQYRHVLSAELSDQLAQLGNEQGVSLYMTLLSVFSILLSNISRQQDICIGSPIANRTQSQTEQVLGLFVNTMVMRSHIQPHQCFAEFLAQTKTTCLDAYAHQDLPFDLLLEQLQPQRSVSHSALFQVMLVLQEEAQQQVDFAGGQLTQVAANYPVAKFDITLFIEPCAGQLQCVWEYANDLFTEASIARMAAYFNELLLSVTADAQQTIARLPLMLGDEHHRFQQWNNTDSDYPSGSSIAESFAHQVAATPEKIALSCGVDTLTYQQLNQRSNQLAHYLGTTLESTLAGQDQPTIALLLERGIDVIVAMLAITKVGGTYLPIDPAYPVDRIQFMLQDSQASMLLSETKLLKQLPPITSLDNQYIQCIQSLELGRFSQQDPVPQVDTHSLAYIMYTSGSTGKPKGTLVTHRGVMRLVKNTNFLPYAEEHVFLQNASVSFDAATLEIWGALLNGAKLVIVPPEQQELIALADIIYREHVSILWLTSGLFNVMIDEHPESLQAVKYLMTGGEALSVSHVNKAITLLPNTQLINGYGPTENTAITTFYPIERRQYVQSIPIGKPVSNTRVMVVDNDLRPVGINMLGELVTSGAGLALGYLGRPALTAEKFVDLNVFGQKERFYRTGDLVRWLADGNLDFVGRIDNQVKLRGFRIEPGEIEAAIEQHADIKKAVVKVFNASNNDQLVAYLVVTRPAISNQQALFASLKSALNQQLPSFMVPNQFMLIEQLPLTANGKIDYRALPEPVVDIVGEEQVLTPTETKLAGLWMALLNRQAIRADDDFFALGGHSLMATQLISRIRNSFQVELPVRSVFEHAKLRDLALMIEQTLDSDRLPEIVAQIDAKYKQLSFAQQRLWFLDKLEEERIASYNIPMSWSFTGPFNFDALCSSLDWIVERHSSFRTCFKLVDEQPQAQILSQIDYLDVIDLRESAAGQQRGQLDQIRRDHANQGFDLENGPLFRAAIILLSDTSVAVLLNMHHIISDGWSMRVFMRDWQHAYAAFVNELQPDAEPLTIAYSDFAVWQRQWLGGEVLQQQLNYWQQQLNGVPEKLSLLTDKPRPAEQNHQGASFELALSPTLSQQVTDFSRRHGVSVFMTLLAAFYILLSRYSRQHDICVGTPVANRTHQQTEDLIGFFVNTLILRADVDELQSFSALLMQTRKTCLDAYANQDVPFEMLVEKLQPTRSLSHSPLFQVMLSYIGDEMSDPVLSGLQTTRLDLDYPISKFDLTLNVEDNDGYLNCAWEYATSLFEPESIAQMAKQYETLLANILAEPEQHISKISMLPKAEMTVIQTLNPLPETASLTQTTVLTIEQFECCVDDNPDNIAIIDGDHSISYRELNVKINQCAHYLREQCLPIYQGAEVAVVAIAMERSIDMLIAVFATLKSGMAYLPIDPSYPLARVQFILRDSGAKVVLTESAVQAQYEQGQLDHTVTLLSIDQYDWENQPDTNLGMTIAEDDPAYIIYTSGSTGQPKGVLVEHSALHNFIQAALQVYNIDANDRVLQFASLSFDTAAEEIFPSLCSGATLCLRDATMHVSAEHFLTHCRALALTVLDLPTAFWQQLLIDAKTLSRLWPDTVRLVIVGGEAVSADAAKQWFVQLGKQAVLLNTYGPTEATIVASYCQLQADTCALHIPIGRGLPNVRLYVLDEHNQVQPLGVPGELCIAGAGLARGYINQPEKTSERFIQATVLDRPERLYKTGDIARWHSYPDGSVNLQYLGRKDFQVKLRGFRIELGEIETLLVEDEHVLQALVLLDSQKNVDRLIAYLLTHASERVDIDAVKAKLKAYLPAYMVPSHFVLLSEWPLNASGKIDRKALPDPALSPSPAPQVQKPPATDLERKIADIWCRVLNTESINVDDNFFDLGGHSLLLMQVHAQVQNLVTKKLPAITLFQYPTIHLLAAYLSTNTGAQRAPLPDKNRMPSRTDEDIAIIGMAGRFPEAADIDAFWQNLREGKESINFFSREELSAAGVHSSLLDNPDYVGARGILEDADLFDAHFFGYTDKEADFLDPQQRVFLESAWSAIEHAGYDISAINFPVGVFAGADASNYLKMVLQGGQLEALDEFQSSLADSHFIASSTAYKLNLTGPALFVHTACSTGLVATHVAKQSLLNNECDIALAGSVHIGFPQKQGYLYQPGMILSPDGHCRAFDQDAQGAVGGEGVGVVVLKRLSRALADGDTIHAVIKGSAINNDGKQKVGFTAPSVTRQAAVINDAMRGLDYDSISYIETHGTATALGDPIEVSALTQAYRQYTDKSAFCAIGSVKSNIGHLNTAAGIAGLIKTVQAVKHRQIPASLHFNQANPNIDFADSPFMVNASLKAWHSQEPLRAGVSSFGIGGTNAHVVLEQAPKQESSVSTRKQLICVSARTASALQQSCDNLAKYLSENTTVNLADVAHTLHRGRQDFAYRGFLSGDSIDEVAEQLYARDAKHWRQVSNTNAGKKIAFLFTGQGAQYVNMGRDLYEREPIFKECVDHCAELLKQHSAMDIRDYLYPDDADTVDLTASYIAQPALFITEYALAKLCQSWGLVASAMIGHSVGEYVAACLAGVFSVDDALRIIFMRAKLMEDLASGQMLSILAPRAKTESILEAHPDVYLAAHNAPDLCVVSATADALASLISDLREQRIMCSRLNTSNAAHSPLMAPIMDALRDLFTDVSLQPPQQPYIANLTGDWISDEQACSVDYWCEHLLNPVLFSEGLQRLFNEADYVLLELGPEMVLTSFALQHQTEYDNVNAFNLLRTSATQRSDQDWLIDMLGQLWLNGITPDWQRYYSNERRLRVPLPSYPFERQRYWLLADQGSLATPARQVKLPSLDAPATESNQCDIDSQDKSPSVRTQAPMQFSLHARPNLSTEYVAAQRPVEQQLVDAWQLLFGVEPVGIYDNFFELGGHSLLGLQLSVRLRETLGVELPFDVIFKHPIIHSLAEWIDLQQGGIGLSQIEKLADDAPLVLSYAQQRLWFIAQLEGRPTATYNLPEASRMRGPLNTEALEKSLRWLVARQPSLRSYYPTHDGLAQMRLLDVGNMDVLSVHDLRDLDAQAMAEQIAVRADDHANICFNLQTGPLFKADLLLLGDDDNMLLTNMHHIVGDGWSNGVFVRQWQAAYAAYIDGCEPDLPPLEIYYHDYAAWQRNCLQGDVLEQHLSYWQKKLAGAPELISIPTDKPRPPQQSYKGAHHVHHLSKETSEALARLSKDQGVTVFMSLVAALHIVLARYSGQDDVCLGTPVANRTHGNTKDLIGFFANTLVLRGIIDQRHSFIELLKQTSETCIEAYAHEDVPFDMVVDRLRPSRSLGHNPLFQVMFGVLSNLISDATLPGVDVEFVSSEYPVAKFDITLYAYEENGRWLLSWEYATDLFEPSTIQGLADHFDTLVQAIVLQPDIPIAQLSMMSDADIQHYQIGNATNEDYISTNPLTVVDGFEQQVQKTPNKLAVQCFPSMLTAVNHTFEQLSYAELNAKANQLAWYLAALMGSKGLHVKPLIAIALERSEWMLIAQLAVLKLGSPFLPIDTRYPRARIAHMLEDSQAELVISQQGLVQQLPLSTSDGAYECVLIDQVDVSAQPEVNVFGRPRAEDLAYVIYTSGSTGLPKGVMVEHKSLMNLCGWHIEAFSVVAEDRATLLANSAFDASVWELWPYLMTGACVIPAQLERLLEQGLWFALEQLAATISFLPTPIVERCAADPKPEKMSLRWLLTGGDVLHKHLANLPCPLVNNYGPTEATVVATSTELAPLPMSQDQSLPLIGKPVSNTQIYILDSHHQLQPKGIVGELCIAGSGLARGYINQPQLTEERFVEIEILDTCVRVYKTGDLARWTDAGIEYLGRKDNQVSLRGFRIELGEIEAVLLKHQRVKEAAVIVCDHASSKHLVAYISEQFARDIEQPQDDIKHWLSLHLPEHMVPEQIVVLEQLPINANGKLDRKALPSPAVYSSSNYQAPRNTDEANLTEIWCRLLNQTKVGIFDNFFDLGGDSILSIQLVSKAREVGIHLNTQDVFTYQNIAEQCRHARPERIISEQGLVAGKVPLTPIQLWFFDQHLPNYHHFNQSVLWRVPSAIDADKCQQAYMAVVAQHDALRLCFEKNDMRWGQFHTDLERACAFSFEDLSGATDINQALFDCTLAYQQRINISEGPISRLIYLQFSEQAYVFWSAHHLVVDAVSWRILQEDFEAALTCDQGQSASWQTLAKALPEKTSSFKAWSESLRAYAQTPALKDELEYWQSLPSAVLPVDFIEGENTMAHFQLEQVSLTVSETTALVQQVPAVFNTQINDVLLTALALALSDWTGHRNTLINLESHGRTQLFKDLDLSRSVGWFTCIYPVGLTLDEHDYGALLQSIKQQLRAIPEQGIGYGVLNKINATALPSGEISFNYLGQMDAQNQHALLTQVDENIGHDVSASGVRAHKVDVYGGVSDGKLTLYWGYSASCYKSTTIDALARAYKHYLRALIKYCCEQVEFRKGIDGLTPLKVNHASTTALFCLPGIDSQARYFRPLAASLDIGHSTYGLELPNIREDETSLVPIEAVAAHYFALIKKLQANGPYYILGHSFGAVVALELAWLFEQNGDQLALMAIVDQTAPELVQQRHQHNDVSEFSSLCSIVDNLCTATGTKCSVELTAAEDIQQACGRVVQWLKDENLHELLLSPDTHQLYQRVVEHRLRLSSLFAYQPESRVLNAQIDVFCTVDTAANMLQEYKLDQPWGWQIHSHTKIRSHVVEGSHFSVLKPPYVKELANKLSGVVQQRDSAFDGYDSLRSIESEW